MVLQGYLNVPIKKVMKDAVSAKEKHYRKLATVTCLWSSTHHTTLQQQDSVIIAFSINLKENSN